MSLLNVIKKGNNGALKIAKLLFENSSISKDIVVLFNEMYLQKCVDYCGGEFFGSNINNDLYKSIVCIVIIGLKVNVPYVVKAAPVTLYLLPRLKSHCERGTSHYLAFMGNC